MPRMVPLSPEKAHVVAAYRQLQMLIENCKVMTLMFREERDFVLESVRPALAALQWLNENRFFRSAAIRESLLALELAAEKIAQLPVQTPPWWAGASDAQKAYYQERIERCPHCSGNISQLNSSSEPFCPRCFELVVPSLRKLASRDGGFGTEVLEPTL